MPRADIHDLLALDVPLPPLHEQRRIAAILRERMAAVDRARAAAEAQLVAARALPAAYLRAVFESDEAREWPTEPLGNLIINYDGRRVPVKLDERRNRNGPYPYYGASGIIDHIDQFLFNGDYLLISEDGANLLARTSPIAFKASGRFWVNNHAHVVQPKRGVFLEYLAHCFALVDLRPYVTGAAQPKLTQDDMNSIPIWLPPLSVQWNVAAALDERMSRTKQVTTDLEHQLDAINRLPAALLRQAFSGEV